MINKILAALSAAGIKEYLINDSSQETIEMFFIKKRLDTRRCKNVRHFTVTVYHDFEKNNTPMRGLSTVSLYSCMTEAEIQASLTEAYNAAGYVCNQTYTLPVGEAAPHILVQSSLSEKPLDECCNIMVNALFEEDTRTDVFMNSAEIFLKKTDCRIKNSAGTDVSYTVYNVSGEFVAQAKEPQDVETYQSFSYNNLDTEALKSKVKKTLETTKARAEAVNAPAAGTYRVIISGAYMKTMFDYYLSRAGAHMIYPKYSSYEIGTKVQGDDVKGDLATITLKAKVPYSSEGTPMIDRPLLDKGELKSIYGAVRFSSYLGIEPTGVYSSIEVAPGTMSLEEMKSSPYLEVVNFSDFQMDDFTGHFGGEIRLAFLYDGDKVTPVTGGSINGCILDVQGNMFFSTQLQTEENYVGPYSICLEGIQVAGE